MAKTLKPNSRNTFVLKASEFFDWKTGNDFLNVFESPHDFFEKIKANAYSYRQIEPEAIKKYSVKTYLNPDFLGLFLEHTKNLSYEKTNELMEQITGQIKEESDIIKAIEMSGKYSEKNGETSLLLSYSDKLMKKLLDMEPWRDVFAALYFDKFFEIKQDIKKNYKKSYATHSVNAYAGFLSSFNFTNSAKREPEQRLAKSYISFENAFKEAVEQKKYDKINMTQAQFEEKVQTLRTLFKNNSNYEQIFFNDGSDIKKSIKAIFSKLHYTKSIEPNKSKYFVDTNTYYSQNSDEAITRAYLCDTNIRGQAFDFIKGVKKEFTYKTQYNLTSFWEPLVSHLTIAQLGSLFDGEKQPLLEDSRKFAGFIFNTFINSRQGVWSEEEALELKNTILTKAPVADIMLHAMETPELRPYFYTPQFLEEAFNANSLTMKPLANYLKIIKDEELIKKIIQKSFLDDDTCPDKLPEHWCEYKLWVNLNYDKLNNSGSYKTEAIQKNVNLFKNIGFAKKMLEQKNYALFGVCTQYKTISRQQGMMLEYIKADKHAELNYIFYENKDNAKDVDFVLKGAQINLNVLENTKWQVWDDIDFAIAAMELIEQHEAKQSSLIKELNDKEETKNQLYKPSSRINASWALERIPDTITDKLKVMIQDKVASNEEAGPIVYSVYLKALKEKLLLGGNLKNKSNKADSPTAPAAPKF